MCIRVQYVTSVTTPYDADHRLITLPRAMSRADAYHVVRAVLSELAIVQPAFGARCFCGAPVRLSPRVPQQRRSEQAVMNRGA